MTIDEFLEKLAEYAPEAEWRIEADINVAERRICTFGCECPMVFVATRCGGSVAHSLDFSGAGKHLGVSYYDSRVIAVHADGECDCGDIQYDPALRSRLLAAVGLEERTEG